MVTTQNKETRMIVTSITDEFEAPIKKGLLIASRKRMISTLPKSVRIAVTRNKYAEMLFFLARAVSFIKINDESASASLAIAQSVEQAVSLFVLENRLTVCFTKVLHALDRHRNRIPAAETQRGDSACCAAAFHFVKQSGQNARARLTDGVSHGNCAAVDVDL